MEPQPREIPYGLPRLFYQPHYIFCTKPCNAQHIMQSLFAGASCDPRCNMQAAEKVGQSRTVQLSVVRQLIEESS